MIRLYALLAVLGLVLMIFLYTREFNWLSNTVGAKQLVISSVVAGLAIAGGILWYKRERFTPVSKHLPEIGVIGLLIVFFSPLFGSWLNRLPGRSGYEQFIFKSEQGYISTGYGILRSESIRPTGWILIVEKNNKTYRFKYKDQPYFPITKPGETIELPMIHGIFGCDILEL